MQELIPLKEALAMMNVHRRTYDRNKELYPRTIRTSPMRLKMVRQEVLAWIEKGGVNAA